ncbi:hypothetical protein H5T54_03425, partial [Candidatus Bipolaricaulota bacterium]|nr:hypothetical protein [Candidatus Bipolaricaulota bacterium]
MKRALLLVLIAVLGTSSFALADCTAGFEYEFGKREVSLSVPAKLVRKVVKTVPVVGQILSLFKVEITFLETWRVAEAVCRCKPCCEAPSFQYLGVTIRAAAEGIVWFDTLTATQPGESPPVDPKRSCSIWTTFREYRAGTKVELAWNLPIEIKETLLQISEWVDCKCTENPECEGNAPPEVRVFDPTKIVMNYGEEAEFYVSAYDPGPRPNLLDFSEVAEAAGCLTAYCVEQNIYEGQYGLATYRVSYTGEEELIKSCAEAVASDRCGSVGGARVDVYINYPPEIRLDPDSRWFGSEYRAFFRIRDPNLRGCPDPWEAINLSVEDPSCGTYSLSKEQISCNWADVEEASGAAVVVFYPQPDCCNRSFTLMA